MTDATTTTSALAPAKQVHFPQGIPGFEELVDYDLLHSDTESGRVYWMTSCAHPDITFTLVDPNLYGLSYQLELTDEEQDLLEAENPEQLAVLLMLWKQDPDDQETRPGLHANIAGPILINVEKRLGMQKLLAKPKVGLNIIE